MEIGFHHRMKCMSKTQAPFHGRWRGRLFFPLPQNMWVKKGLCALQIGAKLFEFSHKKPIRELVLKTSK
ncbi:MAG: hypothetical protein ACK459_08795, partial [Akkermansiaceae bacterium]